MVLRFCNIEYMNKKRVLQYRVSSKNMELLMTVGVAFRNSNIPIQCSMSKELLDVRSLLSVKNGYRAL